MRSLKYLLIFSALLVNVLSSSCGKSQTIDKPATEEPTGTPPLTWKEDWFEHDMVVSRQHYDEHVAFYYDNNMYPTVVWPYKVMSDTWAYVKKTYGNFGDDPRLYVILHRSVAPEYKLSGGHPSPYYDASHDFHNTIDCGLRDWSNPYDEQIGMPIHEVGHIVCSASHGTKGSPSDAIWHDSKFMEIFNYDVLMNIGKEEEALKLYQQMQAQYDDFPRANTQWFKNWFYPIYTQYGKAKVLNKYFELLAAHFPKKDNRYTRDLNWGEFIHFWSGATGVNLKAQATLAFGWTTEFEAQFNNAREDFPDVKYN